MDNILDPNFDLDACAKQGCTESKPDIEGSTVTCSRLLGNGLESRVSCEIGRDFRFLGSTVAEAADAELSCRGSGDVEETVLPEYIGELVISEQICLDCCFDLNAQHDNITPNDLDIDTCQVSVFYYKSNI